MYMAPEKLLGRPGDGKLGDVYALGVTLFEAVTGVKPFRSPEGPCPPVMLMRSSLAGAAAAAARRPAAVAGPGGDHQTAMARDPARRRGRRHGR